jgi:hypothetical protein
MNHQSQADRLLELLKPEGRWVSLPNIMALGIASHTARISTLRRRGINIECHKEMVEGILHTKYRIVKP